MEAVEALDIYSDSSARYRYRVPVGVVRELQYEDSRYSSEFEVGRWLWRFHIRERSADGERFLALHLQSCTQGSIPVHFKLTAMCYSDPLLSKSKSFHCTFKKAGSAWGLNQFISMSQLLDRDAGFVYSVDETGIRCVDFEVTLQVETGNEAPARGGGSSRLQPPQQSRDAGRGMSNGRPVPPPAYRGSPSRMPRNASLSRGGGGGLVPGERSVDRRSASVSGGMDAVGYGAAANNRRYGGGGGMTPPPPSGMSSALAIRDRSAQPSRSPGGGGYSASPSRNSNNDTHRNKGALTPYSGGGGANIVANPQRTAAALAYPFEHLESLCDMTFDVQGVRVKAHRCVTGARMRPLLPDQMLPLQVGCVVAIGVPLDVFTTFLRYVYTEEYPERGTLPPESLLDLYLLAAVCEFYDLGSICIEYVRPLLTAENILPIVLTRYNAGDDVLNALYLNLILENYETLIEDRQFEEIPGHLNRRLLLILYQRETVVNAPIPPMRNTLGKQLSWLAETGEYSDYDWAVGPQKYVIRAHRFILASRSVAFSQALHSRSPGPVPACTGAEFDFSLRSWQKLLTGMYRRHLDVNRDFSAEDIAIIYKMQTVLGMDGHLKKEAEEAFSNSNALRLLIYAVKHLIPELHERAIHYVAANFNALVRDDPQAWDLISELPQSAVVSLFRTVTENSSGYAH